MSSSALFILCISVVVHFVSLSPVKEGLFENKDRRNNYVEMTKRNVNCNVNGKSYNTGEQMDIPNDWTSPGALDAVCQTCTCGSNGSPKDCTISSHCDLGMGPLCAKYKNATGKCCPVCDCYNDGQVMPVGSSWPVKNANGECSMCTCGSDGTASCTAKTTCFCFGEEKPNPGQCCPICVATTTTTEPPQALPVTTERPAPTFPFWPGKKRFE